LSFLFCVAYFCRRQTNTHNTQYEDKQTYTTHSTKKTNIHNTTFEFSVLCCVFLLCLSAYCLICARWITILHSSGFCYVQYCSSVPFSVLCFVCLLVFVLCVVYVCLSSYCLLCMFTCLRTVYWQNPGESGMLIQKIKQYADKQSKNTQHKAES
jgi:hypothetical protein